MTVTKADSCFVAPSEAIAPSDAVARAAIGFLSDLVVLRDREGAEAAEIAAMGMHNAAISYLRLLLRSRGIGRMYDLVMTESERIAARETGAAAVATSRRAKA